MKNLMSKNDKLIKYNIDIHNKIAKSYDERHMEIVNQTEQKRIKNIVDQAIQQIKTDNENYSILDYGCGTGNLIKYLVNSKSKIIAADVSEDILGVLKNKFKEYDSIQYHLLNGTDMSEFKDESLDMITVYSVLHHIPDYLSILKEFSRVLKPGGILYIDHEVNPEYWIMNECYNNYLSDLGENQMRCHLLEIGIDTTNRKNKGVFYKFRNLLKRKLYPERMPEFLHEGDIHTTLYDHIEWDKIIRQLNRSFDVILMKDYLACKESEADPPAWNRWKDRTADMRVLIVRKKRI